MVLARGYTRAGAFIFDSDDETPVPKPHPYKAVRLSCPARQHVQSPPRQPGCISPVKYSSDVSHGTIPFPAGSAPLAGSAQMAKAAAKGSMVQLPIRTPPPPTRVQASNAEVGPPPPGCTSTNVGKRMQLDHAHHMPSRRSTSHAVPPPTNLKRVRPCRRW